MATRLFHISDVHFGAENRGALNRVEQAVAAERPDILVCTGDLTQRATRAQYRAAADWFDQFDIPVWIDPGNHDMPYFNLWERFTKPYQRYNALHGKVAVPTFETDDLVLIPLKTTVRSQKRWPWSDGVVTSKSLAATLALLDLLSADTRLKVVTAHHPLHGPNPQKPNPTIGGNEAFDRLVESGVSAILSGHTHVPFNEHREISLRSAQVIGAGTLSTRLRHGAPASYNALTYTSGDNQIAVETRVVEGPS
ncbi:MAG: metallophosphoesterase [Pseudomonadota bacterium]